MQRLKDMYARNSPTQQCDRAPQPQGVKQLLQVSCCYLHSCQDKIQALCTSWLILSDFASVSAVPCCYLHCSDLTVMMRCIIVKHAVVVGHVKTLRIGFSSAARFAIHVPSSSAVIFLPLLVTIAAAGIDGCG